MYANITAAADFEGRVRIDVVGRGNGNDTVVWEETIVIEKVC